MNIKELSIETYKELDRAGNNVSGYRTIVLTSKNADVPQMHLFVDENGKTHFAIEAISVKQNEIEEPNVNGLRISFSLFRLGSKSVNQYIDIVCSVEAFIPEFIEVVKEIAESIFESKNTISESINSVIRKWRIFWSSEIRNILSSEQQIGLICELIVLEKLCKINTRSAINCWTGPFGERHDFVFTDWCFEVKATRNSRHVHTINGLDQLKPLFKKRLAFISFLVSAAETVTSVSLQNLIELIADTYLNGKPDLIIKFQEQLTAYGYSPMFSKEYYKLKVDILAELFFIVDESFPSLTSDKLKDNLNSRVSSVRYDVSLEGLDSVNLSSVNLGDFFY